MTIVELRRTTVEGRQAATAHQRYSITIVLEVSLSVVYQFSWISVRGAVSAGTTQPVSEEGMTT